MVKSNTNDTPVDPNPNDNTTTPPEKIVSADAAIQEVTNQLSTSVYLRDFASSLVNREATIENGVATLGYRVPGLQPVDRQVSLVDREGAWSILDGAQPVANLAQELTSLLEGDRSDEVKKLVDRVLNREFGQFVTRAAVTVAGMTPSWALDESRTFWVAQGETAEIRIINKIETATVSRLNFRARDGDVSLVPDSNLDDAIESALTGAVVAIQKNARIDWLSGLSKIDLPPENVRLPDIATDPVTQIQVLLSAPNLLKELTISANWIPTSLTFKLEEWKLSAAKFEHALFLINTLNDVDQRPDWVRQIESVEMFHEGDDSTSTELQVVTTAPWADNVDDDKDRLTFTIPWDTPVSDIPMPGQWPLVVRYLDLVKHPIIVGSADPANTPTTAWTLPAELAPLLDVGLATIQLEATFPVKPRPIDDDSPQLNTQIVLSWHPSPSYTGMSADAVTAGLDKLTDGNTLSYGFSLTPNGQDEPESHWQPDSTNGDVAAIVSSIQRFDKLLRDYPRRRELETKLAKRVAAGPPAEDWPGVALQNEDEALQLLQEIWDVKANQADIPVSADLTALSRTIRRNLKGYTKKGTASDKRPELTIFAEYFFGPQSAFAIVWSRSAGVDSKLEGPNLIQFGATDDLLPEAGADATLFDAVFDSVPVAVASQTFRAFAGSIGIVMGLDTPMDLLAEDPALVKISPRTSMLGDWDRVTAAPGAKELKWDSLQILRDKYPAKRSDFIFVSALNADSKSWVRTTDSTSKESAQRARNALSKAMESDDSDD
ncbi:MAG: hypothetical protein IH987_03005 [Planctomycetes bacterium]|nr:hypothetical protein [Planctomycetota bacterium]